MLCPLGLYLNYRSDLIVAVQARAVEQELRQQRHRAAGRALGFTRAPCGAGDIRAPVCTCG